MNNIIVKRIKEISFSVNEAILPVTLSKAFRIEIALFLSFNTENNLVFLVVQVIYYTLDTPQPEVMIENKVQNVFEIENLKNFLIDINEIKLPTDIITNIVNLSISHTRALMAKNIAGTPFQENLIGVVNPEHIARHFFPKMFNIETVDIKSEQPKKEVRKHKIVHGKNEPSKNSY